MRHPWPMTSLPWQILPKDIVILSHWKQLTALRERRGQASTEAWGRMEEGGKKFLLLYAPYVKGKPKELRVLCSLWRSFKAWNAQNSFKTSRKKKPLILTLCYLFLVSEIKIFLLEKGRFSWGRKGRKKEGRRKGRREYREKRREGGRLDGEILIKNKSDNQL